MCLNSRERKDESDARRRCGEMRSEKDPMPACREKSVVEIQFRDIQRDQEGNLGLSKQKEEKKEIFTKVSA